MPAWGCREDVQDPNVSFNRLHLRRPLRVPVAEVLVEALSAPRLVWEARLDVSQWSFDVLRSPHRLREVRADLVRTVA